KSDVEDPTLLERIPSAVHIVRTGYLDLTRWEESTARVARGARALQPSAHAPVLPFKQPRILHRTLRRLGELLRSCLYFPDETVGWVPFGVAKAIALHRIHPFDVIYTSSPPRASLVI